jgi:MFS family permease
VTAEEGRRFPAALGALAHRDFRVFWFGQLLSLIGTWMQSVSQSWLVLELTGSPFKLGLVGMLQFAPMLLFSLVAGVIADRVRKRRLLLLTQSALLVQAFVLAVLVAAGHVQYWHVAVLAVLYGIANTVDVPARQAFVVEMVGRDDLTSAIALNSASFNVARVVGPAVGGLLIARFGIAIAFFLNAFSFVAVLGALLMLRVEGAPRAARGASVLEDIADGLRYVARTPVIGLVLAQLLVVSLFLLNYNVFVPLLARDVLHAEARGFGLLMAALGAGAVLGAVALAVLARGRPRVPELSAPAVVLALAALAMSLVHRFGVAAFLLAIMGFSGIVFTARTNTSLQLLVPDALRGRIMALYMLVFAGVTPFGSLLFGSVMEGWGVAAGFLIAGGGALVSLLGILAWWKLSTGGTR